MQLVSQPQEFKNSKRKVCVAIGVFDGVHLGHQEVIRKTCQDAARLDAHSLVVTFDRHPSAVVAPDRVPLMIQTPTQRLRALELTGVEAVWMIPFDRHYSQKTGEVFVRELVREFPVLSSLSVGNDFIFGHRRSGNLALLHQMGGEMGFQVNALPAVVLDGETVSSTRIRQAITAGKLELVAGMIGRPWLLAGKVDRGAQLGRKLGFPTANLVTAGMVLPPSGVYALEAIVEGGRWRGVMNLGSRPTVSEETPIMRAEVHLLDFDGDLYGRELEVRVSVKLRDEQKFVSVDLLKEQIGRDIIQARNVLA